METHIYKVVLALSLTMVIVADRVMAESKMDDDDREKNREPKLSVFQVVKFTNSLCVGSSKNGTCFTSQECDNLGGVQDGTCADGFGVCCTVTLTTGGSTSVNNSYIEVGASTNLEVGSNEYTICPCSDDICRIKFDFESFDIQGPTSQFYRVITAPSAARAGNYNNQVGQCMIDTFQITSPSGRSSPLICGDNDNQHMILDVADQECLTVSLSIGTTTSATTTRELDIRIIQYRCGDEQGGPAGCLQYFENTSGKIRSFNFPDTTPGTTITAGYAVHLANQHYTACIRRGNGKEIICYVPCTHITGAGSTTDGAVPTAQPSFGLSLSPSATAAQSGVEESCSTDYIWIPGGVDSGEEFDSAESQQDTPLLPTYPHRFCGRYFATTAQAYIAATPGSVCSYVTPFVLGVDFDNNEICAPAIEENNVIGTVQNCEGVADSEAAITPGASGSLGFSLCYIQHTPPYDSP